MAQRFKRSSFGKLPAALRADKEIPKRAGHLFAVMGSYGPESYAAVETLAEDIGAEPPTVRKLQKVLRDKGWIFLLREGRGAGKGKQGSTREWWLNDYPWQHILDPATKALIAKELNLEGSVQALPLKAEGGGVEGMATAPPHTENPNTDNKSHTTEAIKHKQAIGIFKKLWAEVHAGLAYVITGIDHGKLKALLQNELLADYFEAKVRGYLESEEPFVVGQKHSLSLFCSQFNKWKALEADEVRRGNDLGGLA